MATAALAAGSAVVSAGGSIMQGNAQAASYRAEAQMQANAARYEGELAARDREIEIRELEFQKTDARLRGELDALSLTREIAGVMSTTLAVAGASGMDVGSGSTANIIMTDAKAGRQDQRALALNNLSRLQTMTRQQVEAEIGAGHARAMGEANAQGALAIGAHKAKTARRAGILTGIGRLFQAGSQIASLHG